MAKADEPPTGTTEAQFIQPPNDLGLKVAISERKRDIKLAAIQEAEHALHELSTEFEGWMQQDITALKACRNVIADNGKSPDTLAALYDAALEIKAEGQMIGYPFAGLVCAMFCDLLQTCPNRMRIPLVLIDYYVDAVSVELHKPVNVAHDHTARALLEKLSLVTREFLEREQRFADGY